jgi:hypothetical protein
VTASNIINEGHVLVEVSPGELLDKIAILQIKSERMSDPQKLANVQRELELLCTARDRARMTSSELSPLIIDLKRVNEELWEIEDAIRVCESAKDFGERFIQLARSVYVTNDRRAAVKRSINEHLSAHFCEEKEYVTYD